MPRGLNEIDAASSWLQNRLWSPLTLRPALWLDASDSSTITIQTGVSEWRDKSGFNRHFTQSSTTLQPAYQVERFNRLNCIRYDGSNDTLSRTPESWAYQYPIAFFCVFRPFVYNNPAYNGLAGFYTDNVGNTAGWGSFIKPNTRSAGYMTATSGQFNYDGTGSLTYPVNNTYIFSSNFGDGFIQSWGNGSLDGSASGSWTSRTNLGAASMSLGADPLFSRYTNWDMCEIIILNSSSIGSRTTTSRQVIEGYLAWKWGMVSRLLPTHPYATRPPLIGDV